MVNKFKLQREYVNSELARRTTGKRISSRERTQLLRKLWKEARAKYK